MSFKETRNDPTRKTPRRTKPTYGSYWVCKRPWYADCRESRQPCRSRCIEHGWSPPEGISFAKAFIMHHATSRRRKYYKNVYKQIVATTTFMEGQRIIIGANNTPNVSSTALVILENAWYEKYLLFQSIDRIATKQVVKIGESGKVLRSAWLKQKKEWQLPLDGVVDYAKSETVSRPSQRKKVAGGVVGFGPCSTKLLSREGSRAYVYSTKMNTTARTPTLRLQKSMIRFSKALGPPNYEPWKFAIEQHSPGRQ